MLRGRDSGRPELPARPAESTSDKRLELAYDAAKDALKSQDGTFGNIRTRANNILSVAALMTSFSAGLGLIKTDSSKGAALSPVAAWLLLGTHAAIGALSLFVLWPVRVWRYGPSSSEILRMQSEGRPEDDIRKFITEKMIEGLAANRAVLTSRQNALRGCTVLLLFKVAALVGARTIFK